MNYMYITNNPHVAKIAEKHSVDRIWVDLEYIGKELRQKGLDTVKSKHVLSDISEIKGVLSRAKLLVRVNPLNENSQPEIEEAIERGADYIMLPMARTFDEVKRFLNIVSGKAKSVILVETIALANIIDKITEIPEVDEIHIGLNDLHLEYNLSFMFELLINGVVERLAYKLQKSNKTFGIGGVGNLNSGIVPGRYILTEYVNLKSQNVILSRSFCNTTTNININEVNERFEQGMSELRQFEKLLAKKDADYYAENRKKLHNLINKLIKKDK